MSIEKNHEYIDNKYNVIIAEEFWLDNAKFWNFLNKKFDEYLDTDGYKSQDEHLFRPFNRKETCKSNRNSNSFYKYLVLCTRGMINSNNNNFIKTRLEKLINSYKAHESNNKDYIENYTDDDCLNIDDIFMSYHYFLTIFESNVNCLINPFLWKHVKNKTDFHEFLKLWILNILLDSDWKYKNLYGFMISQNFLQDNWYELIKLYNKYDKSKNESQSWDDFFYNQWWNITVEIKKLLEKNKVYKKNKDQIGMIKLFDDERRERLDQERVNEEKLRKLVVNWGSYVVMALNNMSKPFFPAKNNGTIPPSPTKNDGTIPPSPTKNDGTISPSPTENDGTISPSPTENDGDYEKISQIQTDERIKEYKNHFSSFWMKMTDYDALCLITYIEHKNWNKFFDNIINSNISNMVSITWLKIWEIFNEIYENFKDKDIDEDVLGDIEQDKLSKLNKILIDIQEELEWTKDVNEIKKKCQPFIERIDGLNIFKDSKQFITWKLRILIDSYNKLKFYNPYGTRWLTILYAMMAWDNIDEINNDNIDQYTEDIINGNNSKINEYEEQCEERKYMRIVEYDNRIIARYEAAQRLNESKKWYDSGLINISSSENTQDPSWLQIASSIDSIDNKLSSYHIKTNKSEHEESVLKYTAFNVTLNNIFNLSNNPIVQKLWQLNIDLRSELINYWIYDQNNNRFNKEARDNFVSDKLWNNLLTPEEIQELWNSIESLPSEVQKNYEILCGNFDADQDSFEKISKIYALGEIIDNIKTLFAGLNSKKLWDFMSLQLDENEPADIKGDFLFLKWKINWTETNIKYDLRTWKLYMNSFTSQSFNPPKIIVWNTEPNTEIGDLGSFEDAISNLNSPFQIQNNEDNDMSDTWDNHLWDISEDDNTSKQDTEKLIKNKLNKDLKDIWRIVKEKAWEQGKENNVIDDLLKTFNILPDSWEPKGIEFMGWSNLFTLLESIKNTNNEDDLLEFSNQMKELMSLCELSRWKNNENPQKPEFTSITIFDIGEDNATTDIISLQKANKSFFLDKSWEKDKLKSSQSHFDSSIQLSFANIIVQKCCRNTWSWRKIATSEMKSFVKSIKDGIADIKSDKEKILAYETMFDEDVNLD